MIAAEIQAHEADRRRVRRIMDHDLTKTLEFVTAPRQRPSYSHRSFCLIVVDGPDKGATFSLVSGVHSIGRSPECSIVLTGNGVSRLHANVIVKAHGDIIVEDLDSTNGIFLDEKRVETAMMEPGQTLAVGPEVRLRLEMASPGLQDLLREMFVSSTRDNLTGLFNRRGFQERVEIEYAMVRRHQVSSCMAVIDLDRFKAVNDTHGHDAGDVVLRRLGRLLDDSLRVGDLACRWGGEEFTLYLRQTPLEGALIVLERLRASLSEMDITLPKGNTIRVTMSAGVVDLLDFDDWRIAFQVADEALYQAKSDGRDRVVGR